MILGMSLTFKVLPSDRKQANIKPIFKKGRKDQASNYHPISLTPVVCKVLKSTMNDALVTYLERNQSLSKSEHGFCKGYSINTNLIETYDFVTRFLDDGLLVDVILLDQSKAFDKVQHQLLLLKMESYRVHEDIVAWIETFLTGRTQRVVVYDATSKNVYSDEIPVISGVPWGKILGPTLFGIY